jgi:oxalate---CoA ligase
MFELFPRSVRIRDYRSGAEFDHAGLAAATIRRAAMLLDAGAGPGARVVVGHREAAGFIVDLLAIWRIGGVAVAVTPSLTVFERQRVAAAVKPALWIGADINEGVPNVAPQAPTGKADKQNGPGQVATSIDSPALVLMTSGTTSTPKGVVHSYRSLQARISLNLAYIGHRDFERSLAVLPLHFGHGLIGNCLTPLAAGASLMLWPEPEIAGLASLAELIDAHGITFISSVPAMWRVVLKASARAPGSGSLRRVHVGSAPLAVELWEAIADWSATRRVVNVYGTTETANWIGGYSLEDGEAVDGFVGRPWGGAIRVRQPCGQLEEAGEGEVVVTTPALMTEYLDQPELTRKSVLGGWFSTGDRGVIDAQGQLRLIGRRANEINRGGVKIPAEEIDLLLERHHDVAEACAFAFDDAIAGEVVGVAVVPAQPGAIDVRDLLAWCQTRIRKEALPARIFVVSSLPRSDRGKINRDQVRAIIVGARAGEEQR